MFSQCPVCMSVTEWRGNALLYYWRCVSSSVECRVCSLLSPRKPVVVQHTECVQGFGGVTVGAPSYFLHTTVGLSCSCSVCWPARLLCFRLASVHNTVSLWPSTQFSQAEIPNFAASVFQTEKICLFLMLESEQNNFRFWPVSCTKQGFCFPLVQNLKGTTTYATK